MSQSRLIQALAAELELTDREKEAQARVRESEPLEVTIEKCLQRARQKAARRRSA